MGDTKKELEFGNLMKFELEYEIIEPVIITKESTLKDFDMREQDIVLIIRKKMKPEKHKLDKMYQIVRCPNCGKTMLPKSLKKHLNKKLCGFDY